MSYRGGWDCSDWEETQYGRAGAVRIRWAWLRIQPGQIRARARWDVAAAGASAPGAAGRRFAATTPPATASATSASAC